MERKVRKNLQDHLIHTPHLTALGCPPATRAAPQTQESTEDPHVARRMQDIVESTWALELGTLGF